MASNNSINNRSNSLSINGAYSLPTVDGLAGQLLMTNGSGTVSWGGYSGQIAQTVSVSSSSVITITSLIPIDNTIPQISEGDHVLTLNITPKSATNVINVSWNFCGSASGNAVTFVEAFFFNGNTNAFYANVAGSSAGGSGDCHDGGIFSFVPNTTSASTIEFRMGVDAHTLYINGTSSGGGLFGGILTINMTAQEIRT